MSDGAEGRLSGFPTGVKTRPTWESRGLLARVAAQILGVRCDQLPRLEELGWLVVSRTTPVNVFYEPESVIRSWRFTLSNGRGSILGISYQDAVDSAVGEDE